MPPREGYYYFKLGLWYFSAEIFRRDRKIRWDTRRRSISWISTSIVRTSKIRRYTKHGRMSAENFVSKIGDLWEKEKFEGNFRRQSERAPESSLLPFQLVSFWVEIKLIVVVLEIKKKRKKKWKKGNNSCSLLVRLGPVQHTTTLPPRFDRHKYLFRHLGSFLFSPLLFYSRPELIDNSLFLSLLGRSIFRGFPAGSLESVRRELPSIADQGKPLSAQHVEIVFAADDWEKVACFVIRALL